MRGGFSPCFISSETMYCMTSRVMKKILNPHSTYSSRNPQMILPIKPQKLQNPKQKKPLTLTLTKPHKIKKSFANCACEIPFHQLAVLDIYFRGFYPYEKKCKVCCMCFFFTPVTMRWKFLFYTHFFCKDFANKLCITSSALCHVHSAKNIDKFCTLLR